MNRLCEFAVSEPIAYLNGQWLPQSQATLPLHDAGFVMGATVVDFVRTFRHRLGRWPDHLARFQQSVRDARFDDFHYTDDALTGIAEELTRRNAALLTPRQELALIIFATPGPIGYYLGLPDNSGQSKPTLGMHTFPLPFERYRDMISRGAWLRVADSREAVPARCIPPRIKNRSRMHWWLAQQDVDAKDNRVSRALLMSASGHVTETSFANVVIIRGNEVVSPRRDTIFPGMSLQTVEELCPEIGLVFRESDIGIADCVGADAMLLCGVAFCLARVARLNDAMLATNNEALRRLLNAWNDRVGLDIHAQIMGHEP